MNKQVVIGAVVGFLLTALALALWERRASAPAAPPPEAPVGVIDAPRGVRDPALPRAIRPPRLPLGLMLDGGLR